MARSHPGGWSITLRDEDVELLAALMSFRLLATKRLCDVRTYVGLRTAKNGRLSVQDLRPCPRAHCSPDACCAPSEHRATHIVRSRAHLDGAAQRERSRPTWALLASAMSTAPTRHGFAPRNPLLRAALRGGAREGGARAGDGSTPRRSCFTDALRYQHRQAYIGPLRAPRARGEPDPSWLGLVTAPALALYIAELVNESLRTALTHQALRCIEAALRCDSASRARAGGALRAAARVSPFDVSEVKLTKQARADFDLVEALLRGDFAGALRFVGHGERERSLRSNARSSRTCALR
jgi:hypothetical protein